MVDQLFLFISMNTVCTSISSLKLFVYAAARRSEKIRKVWEFYRKSFIWRLHTCAYFSIMLVWSVNIYIIWKIKMSCIPLKTVIFSLDYISGGCSHILWAVGWWSTPRRWGGGGGVHRSSSDRDDQRSWAPVKGFFGVWNFWFWGSLSRLFLIVKTYVSVFLVISFNAFWKFLLLGNSAWDLFGFWYLPPFDHPCRLKSGVHTRRGQGRIKVLISFIRPGRGVPRNKLFFWH